MTKKSETSYIKQYIADTVSDLSDQREAWEEGTYKSSNEELYELLGKCLDFYFELKGNTKKIKALNDYLRQKTNSFREGTSLETRIVRAIFDPKMGKRAHGYAKVIKLAAAEMSPDETMHDFISSRGGVEEIRRTKANGKSDAETRRENIAYAKKTLSVSDPLLTSTDVGKTKCPIDDGAEHSLFVAVVRRETDNSYSIVYETAAPSVVNAALQVAGKEQNAKAQNAKDTKAKVDGVTAASDAVNEAVNLHKANAA